MEQVGLDNEPSDQDTYLPIGNIIGRRIYDEGRQKKTSFNGRSGVYYTAIMNYYLLT